MIFGKRATAPASLTVHAGRSLQDGTPTARIGVLRDHVLALFATAQRLADAVDQQGIVPVPVIVDDTDPEAGPFVLKGFSEHFVTYGVNGIVHRIYGYRNPQGDGTVDPNAQYHLQQMTGQILAFNLYCQRAELEDALGVALQAPDVGSTVDSMLVRLAFFCALFDNMLTVQPRNGLVPHGDLPRQRANLDRYLLMARDKMLAPDCLEALLPIKGWPLIGVELPYKPHEGDYFINGVYFPAEHAQVLLAAQKLAKSQLAEVA
jgi:hypothetical protein